LITGTGHPGFTVKDIETSAKFYTEVMGLKEAFRMYDPDGSVATVYFYIAPNTFIEIFKRPADEVVSDIPPYKAGMAHMCYTVDDAKAAYDYMRSKGAVIDVELKKGMSKVNLFFTHDPDGNRIEIMEVTPESLQYQANQRLAQEK
jgi:Lactoylglutathione lyase and related lyases